MGRIKKAIEKKKKELMWLKIRLGFKIVAVVLIPAIILIVIHVIKKKTKKKIKDSIKESIRAHVRQKDEDDDFEIYDESID
ncbi:MAG: hypothetical protein K6E70_01875 [Butyrivibrio sp.]|nr:hypothetical protein [Butyrivibrio sp.]